METAVRLVESGQSQASVARTLRCRFRRCLDQSLKRMRLGYVDIFYSHRFDPETPLEETAGALASAVRQGKALYAGVSSYSAKKTREISELLKAMGAPCVISPRSPD